MTVKWGCLGIGTPIYTKIGTYCTTNPLATISFSMPFLLHNHNYWNTSWRLYDFINFCDIAKSYFVLHFF